MEQSDHQASEDPELKALRERFFMNYGRLLWRYQQIEAAAKLLGTNLDFEITKTASGYAVSRGEEEFDEKSMGQIQKPLTRRLFATESAETGQRIPDETSVRMVFRPYDGIAPEERIRFEAEYAAVIESRNEMVHCFVDRVSLGKRDSMEAGLAVIEQRVQESLPLHERLIELLKDLARARTSVAEAFSDPMIARAFTAHAGHGIWAILSVLQEAAQESSRLGGWVLLSEAGDRLHREAGKEMDAFKAVTGHKTLKEFLKASQQFEFREEVLPSGGIRHLYRLAG